MGVRRGVIAGAGVFAAGNVDPYWSNVVALLHFDGPVASTSIVDATGRSWSAVGNAQLDTAQSKFGPSSCAFDGTGDVVQTASDSALNLSNYSFTLEAFVRITGSQDRCICSRRISGTLGWAVEVRATGAVWLRARIGATYSDTKIATATGLVSSSAWVHVAVVRDASTVVVYVDGVNRGSLSVGSDTFSDQTTALRIGSANAAGEDYFAGWIDEFRLTIGVARYTSDFTPPSSAFPNTGP